MRRLQLKAFRASKGLSQEEMAKRLGITRSRYSGIEAGRRNGSQEFWFKFQQAFEIEGEEMWNLMSKEGKDND